MLQLYQRNLQHLEAYLYITYEQLRGTNNSVKHLPEVGCTAVVYNGIRGLNTQNPTGKPLVTVWYPWFGFR